ncbi:MAG: class I SAM-dependent methyltransferase [Planctomycetes bacterium]|nr:class I SAM-dependent methyltransferase [Planctomycetota bacterium]
MPRQKPYLAHELEYQRMKKQGVASWNERAGQDALDISTKHFLMDILKQPWLAKHGRVLELGCGTGPLLRWFGTKGWNGIGVDISDTAVKMARSQTQRHNIYFMVGDVTALTQIEDASFDLAIDGQCFHCLTALRDRTAFLREARRVLKPGGGLVLLTMAKPILRSRFRQKHGLIRNGCIYHAIPGAEQYQGSIKVEGKYYVPMRYIEHWQLTLKGLKQNGLVPKLFRVNLCHDDDPLSYLCVAAVKT